METNKIAKAVEFAAQIHANQTDKSGKPYILHVLEVMNICAKRYADDEWLLEDTLCVAVLHDTIEDFTQLGPSGINTIQGYKYYLERIFGNEIYDALKAITKGPHEKYLEEYIPRVADNPIATRVKLADLSHNLDIGRLPTNQLTQKDLDRWNKYKTAQLYLLGRI